MFLARARLCSGIPAIARRASMPNPAEAEEKMSRLENKLSRLPNLLRCVFISAVIDKLFRVEECVGEALPGFGFVTAEVLERC